MLNYRPPMVTAPVDLSWRRPSVGDSVWMRANVTSSSEDRYQWFLNGAPIPDATNYFFTTGPLGPESVGEYSVRAWNPGGAVTNAGGFIPPLLTNTALGFVESAGFRTLGVASDGNGNIYVTGWDSWRGSGIILKKYTAEFSLIWSNYIGGESLWHDDPSTFLQVGRNGAGFVAREGGTLVRFTEGGEIFTSQLGVLSAQCKPLKTGCWCR